MIRAKERGRSPISVDPRSGMSTLANATNPDTRTPRKRRRGFSRDPRALSRRGRKRRESAAQRGVQISGGRSRGQINNRGRVAQRVLARAAPRKSKMAARKKDFRRLRVANEVLPK